jgi:hypothetical protein
MRNKAHLREKYYHVVDAERKRMKNLLGVGGWNPLGGDDLMPKKRKLL